MDYIVPPSFLFDFRLAIPACPPPSTKVTGRLLKLPDNARLFVPALLNERPMFAAVSVGWNVDGLGVAIKVCGKPGDVTGTSQDIRRSDCVLLWVDTRPAGNVHRATEYCHHFAGLPVDAHADGKPSIVVQPIAQQRAQRIDSDPRKMACRTHSRKDGYEFEIWIPSSQLYGFREISETGRIGFYCVVQDRDLGDQPLSVDDEFPVNFDPSTWLPLELLP